MRLYGRIRAADGSMRDEEAVAPTYDEAVDALQRTISHGEVLLAVRRLDR